MKVFITVIAVVIAFSANRAIADNFRCPNDNIVSTGDSISTVASKCDSPDFTFKREEPISIDDSRTNGKPRSKIVYIEVQEWTYNQVFSHSLIFRNGILSEVRFGGYAK